MRGTRIAFAWMLACVAAVATAATVPISIQLDADRCVTPAVVTPARVACIADSKKARERCPCMNWDHIAVDRQVEVDLPDWYHYRANIDTPRTQEFIDDAVHALYGVRLPRLEDGGLVQMTDLAAHPEQFGWIRLKDGEHNGSVAIGDEGSAGIVLGNVKWSRNITLSSTNPKPRKSSDVLLYLSHEANGKVTPALAGDVVGSNAIHVVPREAMTKGAVTESGSEVRIQETFYPMTWNAWVEKDSGGTFTKVDKLEKNTIYTLFVHLSGLGYDGWEAQVDPVARDRILKEVEKKFWQGLQFDALVIPDHPYIQLLMDKPQVTVDVQGARIRDWYENLEKPSEAPFTILEKSGGDAPFVFANVSIRFRTKERRGSTAIGLSIWYDGQPIDELIKPLCIDTVLPCSERLTSQVSGLRSMRAAAPTATEVHGALHFFDFGADRGIRGVLSTGDSPPIAWEIPLNATQVTGMLRERLADFAAATTEKDVQGIGTLMFDLLFPKDDPDSKEARARFMKLLARAATAPEPPVVYVRMLRNSRLAPPVIPLHLAYASPNGPFIGEAVRIEQPLGEQIYSASSPCIADWQMPRSTAADLAPIAAELVAASPYRQASLSYAEFQPWIKAGEDSGGVAVLLLGHYGKPEELGVFQLGDADVLKSDEINHRFTTPAIAILNGCGSAGPGHEQFVTALNQHNVQAIIATSLNVSPVMARDYYQCFAKGLAELNGQGPLGMVHSCALTCLREKNGSGGKHGIQALAYTLLGDPSLCIQTPYKTDDNGTNEQR